MATRTVHNSLLVRLALGLDVAIRAVAIVVTTGLILDVWPEVAVSEPDGDGIAALLFVALCAYVGWSIAMVVVLTRRWRSGRLDRAQLLMLVALASFIRAGFTRTILDEPNYFGAAWRTFESPMRSVVVASWVCGVLAGVAALAAPMRQRA